MRPYVPCSVPLHPGPGLTALLHLIHGTDLQPQLVHDCNEELEGICTLGISEGLFVFFFFFLQLDLYSLGRS